MRQSIVASTSVGTTETRNPDKIPGPGKVPKCQPWKKMFSSSQKITEERDSDLISPVDNREHRAYFCQNQYIK